MKRFFDVFIYLVFTLFFISCGSTQNMDSARAASYYVRANGSDSNSGLSEKTPFKTLTHALEVASKTSIKKITVIGTLNEDVSTMDVAPVLRVPERHIDDPNPGEILITGKLNAASSKRAVLTSSKRYALIVASFVFIRMENIEISGCNGENPILVYTGELTLARGAKVTKNKGSVCGGIRVTDRATLIMRDNAEVSYNMGFGAGGGILIEDGSQGILLDNALVTNNWGSSGGGIALRGSTLILLNNAVVSDNSAINDGGGIATSTNREAGISQITIAGNAAVLKNDAVTGGGIFLTGELILQDNARIMENSALNEGGGIFGGSNTASVTIGPNVILANNQAPKMPDTNFNFK